MNNARWEDQEHSPNNLDLLREEFRQHLRISDEEALNILTEWAAQYDGLSLSETASQKVLQQFLLLFRQGIDLTTVQVGLREIKRTIEILNAFQGRLAILELQLTSST